MAARATRRSLSWSDLRNAEATAARPGGLPPARAGRARGRRRPAPRGGESAIKAGADHARAAPEHAGKAAFGGVSAPPTLMCGDGLHAFIKAALRRPHGGGCPPHAAAASRPTTRSTPRSRSCEEGNRRTSPSASSSRRGRLQAPMLLKMRAKRRPRRTGQVLRHVDGTRAALVRGFFEGRGGAWWPTRPSRSPCSLLCGVCSRRLQMRRSPARCRWSRRPVP